VRDPNQSAIDLNHDLNIINQWAYQWRLQFNPDPRKQATEVLFSCKIKKIKHPPLIFNGTVVAEVEHQKHLGLTLEPNLSFEKHLSEKIKKAKQIIGIMKHLSKYLPLKTLDNMYKALARPHLDYCDIIYHIPSKQSQNGEVLHYLMEKAEQVQYLAALAVTGAWQGCSRSKLYEELGWESLSDRRLCRRTMHFHKIVNNKTPSYLSDKLPPPRQALYRYNNDNTFLEKRFSSDRHKNSFFLNAVKFWNVIISDFPSVPPAKVLKNHLLSLFRPEKKVYSTFPIQ